MGPISVAHCARSKWFCKWMRLILFYCSILDLQQYKCAVYTSVAEYCENSWSSGETFIIMVKDKSVNAGTGLECVISVGPFSPGHWFHCVQCLPHFIYIGTLLWCHPSLSKDGFNNSYALLVLKRRSQPGCLLFVWSTVDVAYQDGFKAFQSKRIPHSLPALEGDQWLPLSSGGLWCIQTFRHNWLPLCCSGWCTWRARAATSPVSSPISFCRQHPNLNNKSEEQMRKCKWD